jgi:hypothetical protein
MISVIESNPDYSGLFAVGSFNGDFSLYVENEYPKNHESTSLFDIKGCKHGITCMKWSACGRYIWIGSRSNNSIICYDIRNKKIEVGKVSRNCFNNQKMTFDLDPWSNFLVTGNQHPNSSSSIRKGDDNHSDFDILVYNTSTFELVQGYHLDERVNESNPQSLSAPARKYMNAHSTIIHPYYSLLFTATGERIYRNGGDPEQSDSSVVEDNDIPEFDGPQSKRRKVDSGPNSNYQLQNKLSTLTIYSIPKKAISINQDTNQGQTCVSLVTPSESATNLESNQLPCQMEL